MKSELSHYLDMYLSKTTAAIRNNMNRAKVNATGATRASIADVVKEFHAYIEASPVLAKIETGNPPKGVAGSRGVTFQAIELWLEAKGLDYNPYSVAAKINKRGTITYREGGRTDIYTDEFNKLENNKQFYNYMQDAIVVDFGNVIDSLLKDKY